MKYELVIVWEGGSVDFYEYDSEEAAEEAGAGMKTALGDQIAWYGTRRKYS